MGAGPLPRAVSALSHCVFVLFNQIVRSVTAGVAFRSYYFLYNTCAKFIMSNQYTLIGG